MKKRYYLLFTVLLIIGIMTGTVKADLDETLTENITSENYVISKENTTISRILPQTNVDDVKKSFNIEASKVHIYDKEGNQEILQGYVGTGMQIRFDNHQTTYTASVIGDLTGNGQIQQIEVSRVIKHVIGLENYQLSGVDAVSADVSADGVIDQKDVSILIKYVVFGRLDIGELIKPTAPIIEVKSGVEGENGWFNSDVILQINEPKSTPIPFVGMYYEIKGTINKELTPINNEDTIVFTGEGIYELKCYTVTAVGEKSLARTQTIKIDKTAPTPAILIGNIKDATGENYEFGTVAYQNIYLQTSGGEDNISGIQSVTLESTGAKVLPKGTVAPTIIDSTGETIVTVTTKNNAGLTSTNQYTVNIDKKIKNPGGVIIKYDNRNGQNYTPDTWTNKNIYIAVKPGGENVTTTYYISGANVLGETDNATIMTKPGISTITVINKDIYGNIETETITVKIHRGQAVTPSVRVKEGLKTVETNQWYISDVKLEVIPGQITEGNIDIDYSTYEETGSIQVAETRIGEDGIITLTQEGIHNITVYSYDLAGNKSEGVTIQVYMDKTDPTPGAMSFYIDDIGGEPYTSDTWTNQSVSMELRNGTDDLSGHVRTVYKVTGAIETGEQVEKAKIIKEGIYIITVITTDGAGRTGEIEYRVKIDKTKPNAPTYQITEGEKENPTNEWFKSNVTLQAITGTVDRGGSGISHTTYEISGIETVPETRIENGGLITLTTDGIYEITFYNYDIAGNKSEGNRIIVKEDKTAPGNITIQESQVTGTSMHLQVSATEATSGIILYQVYVDGNLYREIESHESTIELDLQDLSSKVHTIAVNVKDLAGNVGTASKQINMARLSLEDIDYVEFVVDNFTQTKNNANVATGASYIISDTSTSDVAKYIQVTSEEAQVKGNLTGKIRVVRKNGEKVNEFEYYPENLIFDISQYSYGSGSTWSHSASVNMANTTLSNTGVSEGTITNGRIEIKRKQNSDNKFAVTDTKQTGTKTYTRLIIDNVTLNGQRVMFKITSTLI